MSYLESLPHSGFGSFKWFEAVFNQKKELQQAASILEQGFGAIPVLKYLERQVYTLITEWGAGEKALTVQPVTDYNIKKNGDSIEVFASSFTEYGEQLAEYLKFEDMPVAIREGLQKSFSYLFELEPNEGIVLYSPTEFYKKYKSTSDVINPIIVTDIVKNETGEVTEVNAKGWFLFPNRVLSREERRYWLECHTIENLSENDLSPESIVNKPHYWTASKVELSNPNKNTQLNEYMSWMNETFVSYFGKPLFSNNIEMDDILTEKINQRVKRRISDIYKKLIEAPALNFYQELWNLINGGQRTWAELNQIDFDWYWSQVQMGQINIMGFHPTDGSELSQYWDPFTRDWKGGKQDCGSETKKHGNCKTHGDYEGSKCPECNDITE